MCWADESEDGAVVDIQENQLKDKVLDADEDFQEGYQEELVIEDLDVPLDDEEQKVEGTAKSEQDDLHIDDVEGVGMLSKDEDLDLHVPELEVCEGWYAMSDPDFMEKTKHLFQDALNLDEDGVSLEYSNEEDEDWGFDTP